MTVITAGEPELRAWCSVCQLPTRLRLPLHAGDLTGPVVAVLEICPGCGTGHDRPSVNLVPVPRGPRQREGNPLTRLARHAHARICRRSGRPALACAYADCQWPGLHRNTAEVPGDDGTWRYVFCRPSHKRRWAAEHAIVLSAQPVESAY